MNARHALRFTAPLPLLFALASPAWAGPPARAASYLDGERRVLVERLEAPRSRGGLAAVILHHEGRAGEVRAHVDDTAIVQIDPGAAIDLAAHGAVALRPLMPSAGLWLVADLTGGDGVDLAARLRGDHAIPGVRGAIPNLHLHRRAKGAHTPNDPSYPGQWYFKNLKMPEAWGRTLGDPGVTVVVVDTGCDMAHADLAAKMDPGRDVVDGDDDPSPVLSEDGAAHGTSCAGLIAASTDNDLGIAGGCPECRLRCVRLLSDSATPLSADVDAFQFALDTNASIVSNSWGFVDPMPVPKALEIAINNVFDNGRSGKGALVLFAMGNDDRVVGDDEVEAVRGVLGIGAINNFDEQTPFTNSGNSVDLVAPTGTLTTDITGPGGSDPGDYTSLFGGTSSACPVAAGIAGLLVSVAPEKTSEELYAILIETARPAPYAVPDDKGHDQVYGYGIIDPVKALDQALGVGGSGGGGAGGSGGSAGGAGGASGGEGGGGGASETGGGCSCSTTPASPTASLLYAMGLLLWARRRRR